MEKLRAIDGDSVLQYSRRETDYDPALDVITTIGALPQLAPDLAVNGKITFQESNDWTLRVADITGAVLYR